MRRKQVYQIKESSSYTHSLTNWGQTQKFTKQEDEEDGHEPEGCAGKPRR